MAEAGFELRQVLIWVKQHHVLGRQDYAWQHEPILYGWKGGAAHRWCGGFDKSTVLDDDIDIRKLSKADLLQAVKDYRARENTTVIREDRPHVAALHPTVKPVSLCARLIENSSQPGDLVYEPFAGSGSTLMAAEYLGRRCAAVELQPAYCDVIVRRWEDYTGEKAERA